MNLDTFLLWALIFAVLIALCGVANEILYRISRRWFDRRSVEPSALWDLKKRRGQSD